MQSNSLRSGSVYDINPTSRPSASVQAPASITNSLNTPSSSGNASRPAGQPSPHLALPGGPPYRLIDRYLAEPPHPPISAPASPGHELVNYPQGCQVARRMHAIEASRHSASLQHATKQYVPGRNTQHTQIVEAMNKRLGGSVADQANAIIQQSMICALRERRPLGHDKEVNRAFVDAVKRVMRDVFVPAAAQAAVAVINPSQTLPGSHPNYNDFAYVINATLSARAVQQSTIAIGQSAVNALERASQPDQPDAFQNAFSQAVRDVITTIFVPTAAQAAMGAINASAERGRFYGGVI